MKNTYLDSAFNAYMHFSNENLPLPKLRPKELQQQLERHIEATLNEMKLVLSLLREDEIVAYGKWINTKFKNDLNYINYEAKRVPFGVRNIIRRTWPEEDLELLQDEDPVKEGLYHRSCFTALKILRKGQVELDFQTNKLLEELKGIKGLK